MCTPVRAHGYYEHNYVVVMRIACAHAIVKQGAGARMPDIEGMRLRTRARNLQI